MSPGPVACCRVDRTRSVQARRVAGGSKCVATAGAGHFGPEAMRVCAGKDQRRIMDPLCDRYGGVALIRWRSGVAAPPFRRAPARLGSRSRGRGGLTHYQPRPGSPMSVARTVGPTRLRRRLRRGKPAGALPPEAFHMGAWRDGCSPLRSHREQAGVFIARGKTWCSTSHVCAGEERRRWRRTCLPCPP